MARVEAYFYSFASDPTKYSAHNALTSTEPGPATATVRLAGPLVFADALASFATLLTATALAGTYSVSYSSTTRRVTISATGVATFDLTLPGEIGTMLGFTGTYTGAASYVGDAAPAACTEALGIGTTVLRPGADVETQELSHGRVQSYAFGNHDLADFDIDMANADAVRFLGGPCATGRVRVYQDSAGAYSVGTPGGYVDGYVVSAERIGSRREDEGVLVVRLKLAVPHA